MRAARFRRCCAGSIFVGMLALAGCATTGEQVFYVAPTDQTVTARLEAAWDGKGQNIIVENRSSVEVTATSVHLSNCENIKNPCEVTRLRVPVRPGEQRRLKTIEAQNTSRTYDFRYSWTWEASGTAPALPNL